MKSSQLHQIRGEVKGSRG